MGSWGYKSHENDDVHDYLIDENCNGEPKNIMAKMNIAYMFSDDFKKERPCYTADYSVYVKATQVGVIMWYLEKKCSIQPAYLFKAYENIECILKNKEYIDSWKDSNKRKKQLKAELKQIKELIF